MRDGLKKGMCYKQDVCVSLREYGIFTIQAGLLHVGIYKVKHQYHKQRTVDAWNITNTEVNI